MKEHETCPRCGGSEITFYNGGIKITMGVGPNSLFMPPPKGTPHSCADCGYNYSLDPETREAVRLAKETLPLKWWYDYDIGEVVNIAEQLATTLLRLAGEESA